MAEPELSGSHFTEQLAQASNVHHTTQSYSDTVLMDVNFESFLPQTDQAWNGL